MRAEHNLLVTKPPRRICCEFFPRNERKNENETEKSKQTQFY